MIDIQKDLGANVERETLRLSTKQDAEKTEILAEVKIFGASF